MKTTKTPNVIRILSTLLAFASLLSLPANADDGWLPNEGQVVVKKLAITKGGTYDYQDLKLINATTSAIKVQVIIVNDYTGKKVYEYSLSGPKDFANPTFQIPKNSTVVVGRVSVRPGN